MAIKESLHLRPHHQTFEKFKAVEDNVIILGIIGSICTQLPDLLTKTFDGFFNIFFIFTSI
jgi:hypothetical protein